MQITPSFSSIICYVAVCLAAMAPSPIYCFPQTFGTFKELGAQTGKIFEMYNILEETAAMLEDCAALCLLSKSCYSFFHDQNGGHCRLIAGHLKESQMVSSTSNTMVYYTSGEIIPDFCPAEFDNTSIPTLCFKKIDSAGVDTEEANAMCRSYSGLNYVGHLLTPTNKEMYTTLGALIGNGLYSVDGFQQQPGETWVNWRGEELPPIQWSAGQPESKGEQCVALTYSGSLHDVPCVWPNNGYIAGLFCQISLR